MFLKKDMKVQHISRGMIFEKKKYTSLNISYETHTQKSNNNNNNNNKNHDYIANSQCCGLYILMEKMFRRI